MINKNLIANNYIQRNDLDKNLNSKIKKTFTKIFKQICNDILNNKKIFNIFEKSFHFNFNKKDLKKFNRFNTIAIIGMGGSILGAQAMHNFLKKKIKKKVFFFDNLYEKDILNLKKNFKSKNVLYIIISKSGNTIETISNLFSLSILKKRNRNIIIITEKKDNILYILAKKFDLYFIEHKSHIGGRYSVLSEVGIVPAFLMGLNIEELRKNLKKYLKNKSKEKNFLKESTTILANILQKEKKNNLIFLNYEPKLSKFLQWCQQLIAESLGKKGKGFLPFISEMPKDNHSLLQLYLDGPKDKIFIIFSYKHEEKLMINTKKFTNRVDFLHKKKITDVKEAQKNALIKIFNSKKISFREFTIKNLNEETLGELFCYFILETIIIGKMLNLNPFNQPAVEDVKIIAKKILN